MEQEKQGAQNGFCLQIEQATAECQQKIEFHRRTSNYILYAGIGVPFLSALVFFASLLKGAVTLPTSNLYLISGIVVFFASILFSIQRFHQKQTALLERFQLGLTRIKIAHELNSDLGKETIIQSLTLNPFASEVNEKRIENPLPGHPGSELILTLTNKLLEALKKVRE